MTTLVPRPPYSQDELDRLYPKDLKLQLVQIVMSAVLLQVLIRRHHWNVVALSRVY